MPFERSATRLARVVGRAIRLRCPRCGLGPLFGAREPGGRRADGERGAARGTLRWLGEWFAMQPACRVCGLRFERAQGYFVGAIYINYGVTATLAIGGYLTLWSLTSLSTAWQFALWVPVVVLFPLWFFRYSRSLWLALEYLVNPDG